MNSWFLAPRLTIEVNITDANTAAAPRMSAESDASENRMRSFLTTRKPNPIITSVSRTNVKGIRLLTMNSLHLLSYCYLTVILLPDPNFDLVTMVLVQVVLKDQSGDVETKDTRLSRD